MVRQRAALIDRVHRLVTTDRDILGGIPVFTGTRVPIDVILACLTTMERGDVLKAYPGLTEEQLEAAEVYAELHPRRAQPSKTPSFPPSWKLKSTRRIPGPDRKESSAGGSRRSGGTGTQADGKKCRA
jgi:uncharacterized protein (DUF433 family)